MSAADSNSNKSRSSISRSSSSSSSSETFPEETSPMNLASSTPPPSTSSTSIITALATRIEIEESTASESADESAVVVQLPTETAEEEEEGGGGGGGTGTTTPTETETASTSSRLPTVVARTAFAIEKQHLLYPCSTIVTVRKKKGRRHSFPVIMDSALTISSEVVNVEQHETILVPDKLHPLQVTVNRPAVDQSGFDTNHDYQHAPSESMCDAAKDFLAYELSKERLVRGLKARFPFIDWMRHYNFKENLIGDIVSGITVGIMQIPLGMAYALLGGCPPATGLYTSFFAVIIYCLLGTSKHVSQGTFAVVSLMFAKTVQMYSTPAQIVTLSVPMDILNITNNASNSSTVASVAAEMLTTTMATAADTPTYTPIQVASAIAMMVGIFQVIFGFLRLGALNVYMSDMLVSGFTTGAALLVFTSQFNSFFGISTPQYSWPFEIVYKYIYIFSNLHRANVSTMLVSIIAIVVLAVVAEFINPPFQKKFKVPIPIELIAVVVGTAVSYAMDFDEMYKISVVGFIPSGIPMPSLPPTLPLAKNIMGDAIAVAIVSYVIQLSLAKIFAKKHNYEINANQEFIATGASNLFSSFFSCFPMCVALSRSMVHDSVGGKTQLAGLISCGIVLFVLLAIAPLFQTLPNCILAAIIVVAIRRMFLQFRDFKKAWNISKLEALTWAVTFFSVSFVSIDIGLASGVFFSILTVVWRSQRPHTSLLGSVSETGIYKDIKRYPKAKEEPGIKIYQFASPIIFANSKTFRKEMYSLTGVNPRAVLKKMLKQKRREEAGIKKKVKRRGSLIPPNPSCESLDILYAKSKMEERLPDGIILDLENGQCNKAFESDCSQRLRVGTNGVQVDDGHSSGVESMANSIATLNMYNLRDGNGGFGGHTSNDEVSNHGDSVITANGFGSTVSTVSQEIKNYYAPTSLHHIVIDLSCSSFIDSSGVQVLLQVIDEYQKINVTVYLAGCPVPILDMLESSDFSASAPGDIIFPTVNDAVVHAIYHHSIRNSFK